MAYDGDKLLSQFDLAPAINDSDRIVLGDADDPNMVMYVPVSTLKTHIQRGIDNVPVDGETNESITSNWAYDHIATYNAHIANITTLHLPVQTGSNGYFLITDGSVTSWANKFSINIGFGISPSVILHVGSSSDCSVYFDEAIDATGGVDFRLRKARNTMTSPNVVIANDYLGALSWYGYDGSTYDQGSEIRTLVTAIATGNLSTTLEFRTASVGSVSTTMTLDKDGDLSFNGSITAGAGGQFSGNVGIGISPSDLLHLGSDSDANLIFDEATDATGGPEFMLRKARNIVASPNTIQANDYLGALTFYGYDGSSYDYGAGIRTLVTAIATGNLTTTMEFRTVSAGSAATTMTLNETGDLQIDGDLTISGSDIYGGTSNDLIIHAQNGKNLKLYDDGNNGLLIAEGGAASFSHGVIVATGNLSVSLGNIIVAGGATIDGVDVSDFTDHSARHELGGVDVLNINASIISGTLNVATGGTNSSSFTADRVIVSSVTGLALQVSSISTTVLGYLSGVTSAIQSQLNGKASSSHSHSYNDITGGVTNGFLISGTWYYYTNGILTSTI